MIEGADGINICTARSIWRKARKQHTCAECFRKIESGEKYQYDSGIGPDRDPFWYKTCLHCVTIMTWLEENCSGYLHETIVEDIHEHAKDYKRMDLYRLTASAFKKWTGRNGLMKIPPVPPKLEPKVNTRGTGFAWQ